MKTPRVRLRITAYHRVEASLVPWIRNQGAPGARFSAASPASISCPWVAT